MGSVCRKLLLLRRQLEPESPDYGGCAVGFFSPCIDVCVFLGQVIARFLTALVASRETAATTGRMLYEGSCAGGFVAVAAQSVNGVELKIGDKPLGYPHAFPSSQRRRAARGISYVSALDLFSIRIFHRR